MTSDELLTAQIVREQEWAHALWLQRMTWAQMRIVANEPPERGGLGYDLSHSALKGLVKGYRDAHGDLVMSRADRLERRQAERDALAAGARRALEKAHELDVIDHDAAKLLLALHKAEADDHGDTTQRVEVDVTHHDAVDRELNDMLRRAGHKPLEVET